MVTGVLVCLWVAGDNVGLAGRLDLKQVAHAREGLASVALGEKAVVMMWTASPERHQVPRRDRCRSQIGKPSMRTFIRIGIDLAKNFFQVHAIEREGEPAVRRKLSRGKVLAFFAQAAPCRVGMEACGSSPSRNSV